MKTAIAMRASKAPMWVTCGRRATFEAGPHSRTRAPSGLPVSIHVGNLAHEVITGEPAEIPDRIAYDETTRNEREAHRHALSIAERARQWLDGREIVGRERFLECVWQVGDVDVHVSGHVDLVLGLPGGALEYADLKTGRLDQRSAFIQMAVYALLGEQSGDEVERVTILWAARNKDDATVLSRTAESVRALGLAILTNVARQAANGTIPFPGKHCQSCSDIECVYNPENDNG